ncbi:MAG: cation:proton antiporter [Lachnospiraceae bacterium]
MAILEASFLLILLVIVSSIINHYIPSVPTALIEVAVGLFVALVFQIKITIEADWFMLLFVAPLLYNDAKAFPKKDLWELRAPIFANAILLVILTTVAGGFLVHLAAPFLPLPLTMALVAVLSPTDPVAVHSIAEQAKLPNRILRLISGESLINDASGLIAFKYALAAFLTGTFSFFQAATDFLYMALVGMILGLLLSRILYLIRSFLIHQGIRDVVLHASILITTPFLIYIAAEFVHASGVIAVVTAGVTSIRLLPLYRGVFSEIALVTNRTWDIIGYLLNGAVFVILGAELPLAMRATLESPKTNNWQLIGLTILIWLVLLFIRIIWSYVYLGLSNLTRGQKKKAPSLYSALLTGLTGVRGAITMSTVMSMPVLLSDGTIFAERSIVIFLASGVVLLSLLVATFLIPLLTKQHSHLMLAGEHAHLLQEDPPVDTVETSTSLSASQARAKMLENAIETMRDELETTTQQKIIVDILRDLEIRLRHLYRNENSDVEPSIYEEKEGQYRRLALEAEKNAIKQMHASGQISDRTYQVFVRPLERQSQQLSHRFLASLSHMFFQIDHRVQRTKLIAKMTKKKSRETIQETFILLETEMIRSAIEALNLEKAKQKQEHAPAYEISVITQLISEYRNHLERIKCIKQYLSPQDFQKYFQENYMKVLISERRAVQKMYEEGEISLHIANTLRQTINYSEMSMIQNSQIY